MPRRIGGKTGFVMSGSSTPIVFERPVDSAAAARFGRQPRLARGRLDALQQLGADEVPARRIHRARHGALVHAEVERDVVDRRRLRSRHGEEALTPALDRESSRTWRCATGCTKIARRITPMSSAADQPRIAAADRPSRRWSASPDARLRQLMQSLRTSHLHRFVVENGVTEAEFERAVGFIVGIGQATGPKKNEGHPGVRPARRLDARRAAEQPGRRRARLRRRAARAVLAQERAGLQARREHRPRGYARAGARGLRHRAQQRRPRAGRRRGRRLAGIACGAVREPGRQPARHEPARPLPHRRRRALPAAHGAAGRLPGADRRPLRRSCSPPSSASRAGRRTCTSWSRRPGTGSSSRRCSRRAATISTATRCSAPPRRSSAPSSRRAAIGRRELERDFELQPGETVFPHPPIP